MIAVRGSDYWPTVACPEHSDPEQDQAACEAAAAFILRLPTRRERLHMVEWYEAWNSRRYADLRERIKRKWESAHAA